MANIYERDIKNIKPADTDVKYNLNESNEIFEIKQNKLKDYWYTFVPDTDVLIDGKRMLTNILIENELVKELWKQKFRLDSYFKKDDPEKKDKYYLARNSVFPQDQKGSKRFRNRAGDKLFEVHESVGLFPLKGGVFFDVCGGPGAWSEVLLNGKNWDGYGMTLKMENKPKKDMWYKHLNNSKKWSSLWGVNDDGDIYNVDNLNHASKIIKNKNNEGVTLVIGDGGFHIDFDENGKNMEHLQEIYSARIILGELLAGIKTLKQGGYWCCKFFDTFSYLTTSIIYIAGLFFKKIYIVKPKKSRIVNSERYVVGHKFDKNGLEKLIKYIENIYKSWDDKIVPISLVPMNIMMGDKDFIKSFCEQNKKLINKQIIALKTVMDLADTY